MTDHSQFTLDDIDPTLWDLQDTSPEEFGKLLRQKGNEKLRLQVSKARLYASRRLGVTLHTWQEIAIARVLLGKDTLVCAGTGMGKSMVFQTLLLDPKSTILIISPLNALISEQVAWFRARNIETLHLTGKEMTTAEWGRLETGKIRVVVANPEMLLGNDCTFWKKLGTFDLKKHPYFSNLVSIVIDEVHMVKKWGESSFRIEFKNIGQMKTVFPKIPFLCLSATMQPSTRSYIHTTLNLQKPSILIKESIIRTNINIMCARQRGTPGNYTEFDFLFSKVTSRFDIFRIPKTMLFVDSKKDCQSMANYLRRRLKHLVPDITAQELRTIILPYTAAYSDSDRKMFMQDFVDGDARFLICTDAASLGLNVRNVEVVIQFGISRFMTISDIVQRIGRAARDPDMKGLGVVYFKHASCTPISPPDSDFEIDYTLAVTNKNKEAVKKQLIALYRGTLDLKEDPAIRWLRLTHGCRNRLLLALFHDDTALDDSLFEKCECDSCYLPPRAAWNRLQDMEWLKPSFVMPPPFRNGRLPPGTPTQEQINELKDLRAQDIDQYRDFAQHYSQKDGSEVYGRFTFDYKRSVRYLDTCAHRQDEVEAKIHKISQAPKRSRKANHSDFMKVLSTHLKRFETTVYDGSPFKEFGLRSVDIFTESLIEKIAKRISIGWAFSNASDLQAILGKRVSVQNSIFAPHISDLVKTCIAAKKESDVIAALHKEERAREKRKRDEEEAERQAILDQQIADQEAEERRQIQERNRIERESVLRREKEERDRTRRIEQQREADRIQNELSRLLQLEAQSNAQMMQEQHNRNTTLQQQRQVLIPAPRPPQTPTQTPISTSTHQEPPIQTTIRTNIPQAELQSQFRIQEPLNPQQLAPQQPLQAPLSQEPRRGRGRPPKAPIPPQIQPPPQLSTGTIAPTRRLIPFVGVPENSPAPDPADLIESTGPTGKKILKHRTRPWYYYWSDELSVAAQTTLDRQARQQSTIQTPPTLPPRQKSTIQTPPILPPRQHSAIQTPPILPPRQHSSMEALPTLPPRQNSSIQALPTIPLRQNFDFNTPLNPTPQQEIALNSTHTPPIIAKTLINPEITQTQQLTSDNLRILETQCPPVDQTRRITRAMAARSSATQSLAQSIESEGRRKVRLQPYENVVDMSAGDADLIGPEKMEKEVQQVKHAKVVRKIDAQISERVDRQVASQSSVGQPSIAGSESERKGRGRTRKRAKNLTESEDGGDNQIQQTNKTPTVGRGKGNRDSGQEKRTRGGRASAKSAGSRKK